MPAFIPPDKEKLRIEFQLNEFRYKTLRVRVKEILEGILKTEQIRILPLVDRVKKFESFYDKIIHHDIHEDYFNNVEDIAGVRVICAYFSDLDKVGSIIENTFDVIRPDRKTIADIVFGYQSDHYIVKLREMSELLPTDKDLMNLKCEIQVRTILMHAWDTVSHELDYKKEKKISDPLRKEMYAVSSLLYVADQRFDAYKRAAIEEVKSAQQIPINTELNLNQAITPASLEKYLQWRFSERKMPSVLSYEELAQQLNKMNFDSLQSIDNLTMKARDTLLQYEKEYPPNSMPGTKYDRIGAARICIALADTRNKESDSFYVINLARFRQMVNRAG